MPLNLPALTLARRAQERAKREELLSTTREALIAEAQSSLDRLRQVEGQESVEEELGHLLFVLTNLGHQLDIDAESALRTTTVRFGEEVASARSEASAAGEHETPSG
jgi:ATP diphosphatase